MIRVLIADDHPLMRAGLEALFATADDIALVGAAGTADDAVALAARESPDVVLMDLQFAGSFDGAGATRRIRAAHSAPAVVVLTNYDSDGDILAAIEAGADGYLLKDSAPDALLAAVRSAAAGRGALTDTVRARLARRASAPQPVSAREVEVLQLVADGLSNAEIAQRLFVSEATVKSHLAHTFPKLGVQSRTAAVVAARDAGLIRRA